MPPQVGDITNFAPTLQRVVLGFTTSVWKGLKGERRSGDIDFVCMIPKDFKKKADPVGSALAMCGAGYYDPGAWFMDRLPIAYS